MKDWLTIGQFAKEIGVTRKALRLYEEMGLLVSHARGENGYRYYSVSQIPLGKRLQELKALGFSLIELKALIHADTELDSEKLKRAFQLRIDEVDREMNRIGQQKKQLHSLLSSLRQKNKPLTERERRSVMKFYAQMRVVVTGVDDLSKTAKHIATHLRRAGENPEIVAWSGEPIGLRPRPCIVIVPESELAGDHIDSIDPDVVVVRNVSSPEPNVLSRYLRLYNKVGPIMASVLNADDRASVALAAESAVRKGKIFYFSKNAGVESQIKEIGGIVSDGEEIRLYGFNSRVFGLQASPRETLTVRIGQVLAFGDEVALMASLAAVLDVGLEAQQLS